MENVKIHTLLTNVPLFIALLPADIARITLVVRTLLLLSSSRLKRSRMVV